MKFYRYDFVQFAVCDENGEYTSPKFVNPIIQLSEYALKEETEKGYWIGHVGFGKWKKWIPRQSKKRFAYPTKEEAMLNLKKRTEKRIEILKHQLKWCEVGLSKVKTDQP
jgi:hypothetical protein